MKGKAKNLKLHQFPFLTGFQVNEYRTAQPASVQAFLATESNGFDYQPTAGAFHRDLPHLVKNSPQYFGFLC